MRASTRLRSHQMTCSGQPDAPISPDSDNKINQASCLSHMYVYMYRILENDRFLRNNVATVESV